MREICLVLASCSTLFVGRAEPLIDGNQANVATNSRSPPHQSETTPKRHRLLQPYGSAVDTTTSVAQRLLKSYGPVTENTKLGVHEKEERVLDIAEVEFEADKIAKVMRARYGDVHLADVSMEKFKALGLTEKERMDASNLGQWIEFNAFHGYTHPDHNPSASQVAILMKHKTPIEVVEALTSLPRENYFWHHWSSDLHRAIASHYLEQKTPKVMLNAWLDLDLKPRDLYDDLGFSKEVGGVRDSPEAALMFYKYAELYREEGKDYALSADETAAHMFRNLLPEEAIAFVKKAEELKLPGEFAKVVHELQLTSEWIEKFRENLADAKKLSEEEFVRLGLTEEGPVDFSKLDRWTLFNKFRGYTHPYRNPDALQVAILMKHKTAEEVVKALLMLPSFGTDRYWAIDLHKAIASYYLEKKTPEVMLNAWNTLKLKPENLMDSLDLTQHFSERESTDAAWLIYKYTELLIKQNSGYQSSTKKTVKRMFRFHTSERVSAFLKKAAKLTEPEEFTNLVHDLQPILHRINQNQAAIAQLSLDSEKKFELLGLNKKGPVDAHAFGMWLTHGRKAAGRIPYSSQAVILMKHKTPEEVVGALMLKKEDDLHKAIASYYLEKNTPEVMLNAWLTLELKPENLYHDLGFSWEVTELGDSPGAALMFYKYTELLRETKKDYALSAEQTAQLMFNSLLPDNAVAFLKKASELVGPGEMDKIKLELQPMLRQIEKFRFIRRGLMGKEPVDDKIHTKFAYKRSNEYVNYYHDPRKSDVAWLMENKTPEEVVEALTSIQKNEYWREWATDLHRAIASHYLEQKTPKVMLNAWLDLDLKPRKLYDDLGFSKEVGGVRGSPEAALMFYKYTEFFRKTNPNNALSAEKTVELMSCNLTPEEASNFLETASKFVEPGELDELKHEFQKLSLVSRARNLQLSGYKRQRTGTL